MPTHLINKQQISFCLCIAFYLKPYFLLQLAFLIFFKVIHSRLGNFIRVCGAINLKNPNLKYDIMIKEFRSS